MKADIVYRGRARTEQFPMNSYQLADLSDQMRCEFPFNVRIDSTFGWEKLRNEFTIYSPEDMLRLNLFAQRFENLSESDEAKMYALMTKYPKADISELLDMTYGLESIKVYPCYNDEELTQLAFDNAWLPEFKGCPYEILDYLDSDKVAEKIYKLRDGDIYNGYYVEADGFIFPEMEIETPDFEDGFFRLLLAADRENQAPDRKRAEWLKLPCSKTDLEEFEKRLGCNLEKAICLDRQSALPKLSKHQIGVEKIYELNDLAHKLMELSHFEFIKLKAVMEHYDIKIISDTNRAVEHLSEFGFDPMSLDASIFGKAYLYNNLPIGFDTEIFATADMEEFGRSILSAKGGSMTSYGAVSGRGQSLFTPIAKAFDEEETEDIEDDESEDESEGLEAVLT